jgi:tetratricopeptide (TPR) repeat protein
MSVQVSYGNLEGLRAVLGTTASIQPAKVDGDADARQAARDWCQKADELHDSAEYAAAIAAYDTAIGLYRTLENVTDEDRNDLAGAYMNRGNAKPSAPGHGGLAVLADYDRAIALMEELRRTLGEEWPVPWRNELAAAYMNRGTAKQSAAGHGEALPDHQTAQDLLSAWCWREEAA